MISTLTEEEIRSYLLTAEDSIDTFVAHPIVTEGTFKSFLMKIQGKQTEI